MFDVIDNPVQTPPLLTTKLYALRPRASLVTRPRLLARLDQSVARRTPGVTLVSAPTGYGKSTLIGAWAAQSDLPTAWLSLDQADNDPTRFFSYCIAALQSVWAEVGRASLAALHAPQLSSLETFLTVLINEIATIPVNFILIFDDYHLIENPAIHQAVTFWLNNLPPPLHLVILTRTDPPLPLAHLRARGQLLELRAADLRFTAAEVTEFLSQVMDLNLSLADIEALEARTEGWVAGLQLAALSLQGRNSQEIHHLIATFSGGHRYILDYLAEAVLQYQPAHLQDFLLQTSILDRMCGPLCNAIMGKDEGEGMKDEKNNLFISHPSAFILEQLEQSNLFIVPLDDERQWYRYHHLFADLLRNLLQKKVGKAGVAELHRRAAEWFEQQGLSAEAMRHALSAADVERAARLVEQHARSLLSRSEMATLLSWLDALPVELVRSQAQLSLFQAWALTLTGQLDAVETYLKETEHQAGEMAAIRATVAYFRRDMPQAIALYRQALADLPPDNLFLRGAVALTLGMAHFWRGDIAEASQALTEASTISQATGNLHVALTAWWNLAQLRIEQGQLREAAALCQQAIVLVEQQEKPLPAAAGGVYICLGSLLYQHNHLDTAAEQIETGIKLGQADLAILALGHLTLARIKWAQADPSGAFLAIQQTEQLARRYTSPYWLAQAAAYQARLWITTDQLETANRWAAEYQLDAHNKVDYLDEVQYITLTRLLIAQNKVAEALTLLEMLDQTAQAGGRTGRTIELLTLRALLHQEQNQSDEAVSCLEQALTLAQPEEYIRLFLDESIVLIDLLTEVAANTPLQMIKEYANKLLTWHKTEAKKVQRSSFSPYPLIEPLSERELEILSLIAAGMSNSEIAEKLIVTVGTIKWHLNNIYGKLDARSRTQAVAKARELELL